MSRDHGFEIVPSKMTLEQLFDRLFATVSQRCRRGAAAKGNAKSAQSRTNSPTPRISSPQRRERASVRSSSSTFPRDCVAGSSPASRGQTSNFDRRTATIRGALAQIPKRTWYKSTKTDLVATIALSELATDALRSQRALHAKECLAAGQFYDDLGFVFMPPAGGMPTPASRAQGVRRVAERAGLALRGTHAMRHPTGSWPIRSGVSTSALSPRSSATRQHRRP